MASGGTGAGAADQDGGFTLVEAVISLVTLGIVAFTALPVIVGALQGTSGAGTRQAAVAVAAGQLEQVRAVQPAALLSGRNAGDVADLIAAPGLVDLSNDITAQDNSDPSAPAGSASAAVRPTTTQTVSGVVYTVRTYINRCYLSASSGTCTPSAANGSGALRVSVDVSWPKPARSNCAGARTGQCEYVTTTLIDLTSDPVFSIGAPPTITSVQDFTTGAATTLGPIHPGQALTLKVNGTNFRTGITAAAGNGDTVGAVTGNTGTSFTVTYLASTTLGTRNFVVTDPSGQAATTVLTVARSTPTVTAMTPTALSRNAATTLTLTGTDFFATPSTASPTTQPSVTLAGTARIGALNYPFSVQGSAVTVVSATRLTFQVTAVNLGAAYTASGTLTLTDPDGGLATYAFSVTVP